MTGPRLHIYAVIEEPGNIGRLRGFEVVVHVDPYGFEMMVRKQTSSDILKREGSWKDGN